MMPTFIIEYANIVYKIGADKYFRRLNKSSIGNIVIPDVSLEEIDLFSATAAKNRIEPALIAVSYTHLTLPTKRIV